MSRKAWIPTNRRRIKARGRNSVPIKWLFKSKEEPCVLIRLKYIYVVKGYMQVPVFGFTQSFSAVA